MSKFFIRAALSSLAIVLLLLSFSCTETTTIKHGTINGIVSLDGETNFSGISVHLYSGNVVSPEIRTLSQTSPQLAFSIMDRHVFDHREHTPLHSEVTLHDGSFIFPKVDYGTYIVVYYKENWGFNYLFDVELSKRNCDVSENMNLVLFPVMILPQIVQGEFVFEEDRCYATNSDVTFVPQSKATFMAGSRLLIKPGCNFTIHGLMEIQSSLEKMIIITSSDMIYNYLSPLPFGKFEYANSMTPIDINGMSLSHSQEGLVIRSIDTSIKSSFFQYNDVSTQFIGTTNALLENNVFLNSRGVNSNGVGFFNTSNSRVQKCIFWNNINSIILRVASDSDINNNYFWGGTKQVFSSSQSSSMITNNTFRNSQYAISNTAQSTLEVYFNDIASEICIYTYHTSNAGNLPHNGWVKANLNNFHASDFAVLALGIFVYSDEPYFRLDFKHNFWSVISGDQIEELIRDYNDDIETPFETYVMPLIEYIPFRTAKVDGAGARGKK